jgi:hypothetical protein
MLKARVALFWTTRFKSDKCSSQAWTYHEGRSSMSAAPEKILILHDEYHARHIGQTSDGRQFFLTSAFDPAIGERPGREFVALFLFDNDGTLIEDRIDDLGTRQQLGLDGQLPGNKASGSIIEDAVERRLAELGALTFGDIEIRPFGIDRFDTTFGFLSIEPEEDGEEWRVEFHPGNFMAFYAPWDGEYDT